MRSAVTSTRLLISILRKYSRASNLHRIPYASLKWFLKEISRDRASLNAAGSLGLFLESYTCHMTGNQYWLPDGQQPMRGPRFSIQPRITFKQSSETGPWNSSIELRIQFRIKQAKYLGGIMLSKKICSMESLSNLMRNVNK